MSKYVLYGGKLTRALITEMVMLEAGLEYELREIDIINQQHRSDEYTRINPAALVPSLVTPDGEVLYETPAINLYLAEHHGIEHLAPLVRDCTMAWRERSSPSATGMPWHAVVRD